MNHENGHVYIKSVNLSHNKANERSAVGCWPNKIHEETKHGSDVLYCSFSNNTATSQCIYLTTEYGPSDITHEIKNCNIIENKATNTICFIGETTIYFSSFINNNYPYFYTENTNSKIILSMCYTDKQDTELGSFSISGDHNSNQFIILFSFYETGQCVNHFHQYQYQCHCTEHSILRNLYLHKIIIPSPFIFLLFTNKQSNTQ